jgi:hypothetical protein
MISFERQLVADFDKKITTKVKLNLNKATTYLKEKIVEKTPVDTGELVKNWESKPAERTQRGLESQIVNDTSYAKFVE